MKDLFSEARLALRSLGRRPGFVATAVITLAIGIGATTTIFSVVDHLMLRELPFPDADRVVTLWQTNTREGQPRDEVAPGNFLDWKERNASFAALGAAEPYSFDLTGDGRPEVLMASLVTEGFLEGLGVPAVRGRLFGPEDFRESADLVAVIGWGLWQRRFGGDPAIIGTRLTLDGAPVTVVGILPRDFDLGLGDSYRRRELWVPRRLQGWEPTQRTSAWWTVVGRLTPGVSLAQAQADLDRVAANLAAEYPATNTGIGVNLVPLRDHLVGAARPVLRLLLAAVVLVLLVACVNVANLQLARGMDRARELSVRAALGAGRGRIIRQLLGESLILALAGAVVGIALAFWAVDVVKTMAPGDIPRFETVAVDLRVLAAAVVLGAGTALLFGLPPALRLSRPDAREILAEGRVTPSRRRLQLREGLVILETAMALTLLVGAGLLIRSLVTLLDVHPGFRQDGLAALQVFYYEDGHTAQDRIEFFERTLGEIGALPGVVSAGAVSAAPFLAADIGSRTTFLVVGEPEPRAEETPQTYVTVATPRYFEAMGIPLLQGRAFDDRDRLGAPLVAVINETMRRRVFADRDPIGVQVLVGSTRTPAEIVGVVGDVRHTGLDVEPRPELIRPHAQNGTGSMTYFVRTEAEPASVIPLVQETIWRVAPLQTFYQTGTAAQLVRESLTGRRFTVILLTVFAGIGLVVAAVGIYGVMSFSVTRRTQEVGVRMALGARPGAVVGLIVRRGLLVASGGIGLGLLLALAASTLLGDLLFAVSPRDGFAFAAGVIVLFGSAALACWLPARRAARIDPMEALRNE